MRTLILCLLSYMKAFSFFFLLYFTLQYCIGFAIHWHESATGVHEFPFLNLPPTSHLHIISLDHLRAPAPSILYPVSNIDWRFISYVIVYMFQCHSPKSSYPLPLPQSQKVHSIHLCLFCCLTYRVYFIGYDIATPAFFWSLFAWNIFLQPFTFSLYVSLVLRWLYYLKFTNVCFSLFA